MKVFFRLSALFLGLLFHASLPAESLSLTLSSGDEIPIQRQPADGDTLIIWTPSNFGTQPPAQQLAMELAFENLETWVADLHTGFFVSRGRNSVNQFPPKLLAELVDRALKLSGKKRVLLMTTGSGARPVLQAARQWQLTHTGNPALAGMILFHPSLYAGRPTLGQAAQYLPIVEQTNLPVFIIQPTLSTTHFRVQELQTLLQKGGSQVYLRVAEGARDGFHVRPDDDLGDVDRRVKSQLPTLIRQASQLLLQTPTPGQASARQVKQKRVSDNKPGLRTYVVEPTPPLKLPALDGRQRRLEDYRGQVVLVSFWASWCPPCIEEMPSLNRLQKRLGGKRFTILGVNIGEKRGEIESFLKRTEMAFPILLDENREAYDAWKVYVVPSNFIVDGTGKIQLGSVGAIDWDSTEVIARIERLIRTTTTE